ncbi:Hpt domain-containing protein [Pseudoalteromonas denitrificans]|jgi:HPt (histidine-containing phosphotransfer) domain-containing protein|uniref:Hpt domain-containing protein n=1 Tax=Pseudoalteromonas denitrificans DSM 6059 TaxID=1123010 RepID=A0A1I1EWS1_9GAMM|nr:Hpt domain-containing protein [Pseudoalteromonas denitrificans]SFB89343.1 Hpt domain-containing protein [Pseudoalteromonas denitrificans DSM 6059]
MFIKAVVLKLQQDVGETLAKELMQVFIVETNKLVTQLIKAQQQNNIDDVILISHSLKSSARTYGAEILADLCEKIELEGKNNNDLTLLFSQLGDTCEQTLKSAIIFT